jgi:hypothetical protein
MSQIWTDHQPTLQALKVYGGREISLVRSLTRYRHFHVKMLCHWQNLEVSFMMITKHVQAMKKYTESSITHICQAILFINPLAYVN